MTDTIHDRAIEHAIEFLTDSEAGRPPRVQAPRDADELDTSYVAILALLPFADTPAVPDPALKDSVLECVAGRRGGDGHQGSKRAGSPAESPALAAPVVPLRPRFAPAMPLALAAVLGLCLLGLAFLANQVGQQREEISALAARIEVSESLAEKQAAFVTDMMQQSERHLEMITTVARQAYPMRGVDRAELTAGEMPRGVVWVCERHQRWYLTVQGLEPPPPGQAYNMWFITESGLVNAGIIDVDARRPSELEAQFMPEGTHSFQVTLEPGELLHSEPQGSPVLIADHSVRL